MNTEIVWTQREALQLLPKIELLLKAHGWHCALTGSVLHKGWSTKDLDIIVYPHDSRKSNCTDKAWSRLKEMLDYDTCGECNGSGGQDRDLKEVKWMKSGKRRIDFFFLK